MLRQYVQKIVSRISNSDASALKSRARSAGLHARKPLRERSLRLERLEDRALLSVSTAEYAEIRATYPDLELPANVGEINVVEVDITNSAESLGNLKAAITKASKTTEPDLLVVRTTNDANTITYANQSDTIKIGFDSLTYGKLYIVALGDKPLTIDADSKCQVLSVGTGAGVKNTTVGVANLTLTHGNANTKIIGVGSGRGGGLFINSTCSLTAVSTTISNNISNYLGGGVFSQGAFTAINSVICNNKAEKDGGGGYVSGGTFTTVNTKIDSNKAEGNGGGVCKSGGTFTTLDNTSISNNTAGSNGGGVYSAGSTTSIFRSTNTTICGNSVQGSGTDEGCGGGVYLNNGYFVAVNATIANNKAVYGGGVYTIGGRIKDSREEIDSTVNAINTIIARNEGDNEDYDVFCPNDYTYVYGYSCLSSFKKWQNKNENVNIEYNDELPLFKDMKSDDYSLAVDSQAINKGDNSYVDGSKEQEGYKKLETDVVGNPRIVYNTVDIGAYEYSKTIEVKDASFESFKNAIKSATDGDTIKFASGANFEIDFSETITLNKSITIDGTGADVLFDGKGAARLFVVPADKALTLKSVTLQNGKSADGGAIRNAGTLTLNGVAFVGNEATKRGGAVFNDLTGTLVVTGAPTTFDENVSAKGGAITNYGKTTIKRGAKVAFDSNSATQYGGAYFGCGELTVSGMAIFSDNEVTGKSSKGGAVYSGVYEKGTKTYAGIISIDGGALFSDNSAVSRGGAIITYGDATQDYAALEISGVAAFVHNSTKADSSSYGGAIDVGKSAKATFVGTLEFSDNGKISEDEVGTSYGGAIFVAGAVSFGENGTYKFINNSSLESGGAINASNYKEQAGADYVAGLLALNGDFLFYGNKRLYDPSVEYTGHAGYGGAIATAAPTTIGQNTKFSYKDNSAPRGNCVAVDTISVAANKDLLPEDFGLTLGADYTTFNVLNYSSASASAAILPTNIASEATKATIVVEGVSKTFGMEGVAPQDLGLGVGVYEALVQYEDAAGVESAVYSLVLTVDQGATLDVRETSIANGRGVKFDFNLNKDGRAVSEWQISWGDGTTTRSARLSSSWMAAHYYAQDGVFDVSLTAVYLDGTSETFEKFSTQKIGKTIESEVLATCFNQIDDVFDELENLVPYGPAPLKR